jgi:hypothetical protein
MKEKHRVNDEVPKFQGSRDLSPGEFANYGRERHDSGEGRQKRERDRLIYTTPPAPSPVDGTMGLRDVSLGKGQLI